MSNAYRDENNRPTIIVASNANGRTIVRAAANPSTHRLQVNDGTVGSDNGNNNGTAVLDENMVPVWEAVASDGSGRLIEVYGNPATGQVFIDSF